MKTALNQWPVAAGLGLTLSVVARLLLPWPATRFLIGVALVVIVVCGLLAYMRHESGVARDADADVAEATPLSEAVR